MKLIGYLFVILCPFICGLFPFGVYGTVTNNYDFAYILFGIYSWIWLLIYILWFDGSKLQKSL
jgi:hypothetical protein